MRNSVTNGKILLTYWFVIVRHQVVAFVNTFLFETLGIDEDTESFHCKEVVLAQVCNREGVLPDNFYTESSKSIILICKMPSLVTASSLAIGQNIAERILPL